MKIDNDGLAIARPGLSALLNYDYHLQWDASASSQFTKRNFGRHEERAYGRMATYTQPVSGMIARGCHPLPLEIFLAQEKFAGRTAQFYFSLSNATRSWVLLGSCDHVPLC